jgi:hypothetical protein
VLCRFIGGCGRDYLPAKDTGRFKKKNQPLTRAPEPIPDYQPISAAPIDQPDLPQDYNCQDFDDSIGYAYEPEAGVDDRHPKYSEQAENKPLESTDRRQPELENHHPAEQWEKFVKFMENSADKSLVSLLRNSVLLSISQNSLAIGLQNTDLFSDEKRKYIEVSARAFFGREVEISYKNSIEGIDNSVRIKQEQEKLKEESGLKQAAAENPKVQQILSLFPKSKIVSIEIEREKKDV